MLKSILRTAVLACLLASTGAHAADPPTGEPKDPDAWRFYRELALKIRSEGRFIVPMPSGGDMTYQYRFAWGKPVREKPLLYDFYWDLEKAQFNRNFMDKIFLKDGSHIVLGGQKVPLTCVVVLGQDNRQSGRDTPLLPQFVMKVYLVANDYTCTGPVNPGYPDNGRDEQTWDTYLYYEVRDPTIMLPAEILLKYRKNTFHSILTLSGGSQ